MQLIIANKNDILVCARSYCEQVSAEKLKN